MERERITEYLELAIRMAQNGFIFEFGKLGNTEISVLQIDSSNGNPTKDEFYGAVGKLIIEFMDKFYKEQHDAGRISILTDFEFSISGALCGLKKSDKNNTESSNEEQP